MNDLEIWNMLSRNLAGEESQEDKEIFIKWFNESEKNKKFFYKVENVWNDSEALNSQPFKQEIPLSFREKFTKKKIKDFIINQAVGNFVGFIVGMWVTAMFSHYVLERRGLKNLFGLAGRKKVVVNEIPEWLQGTISILVGFIALELINHFFQTKKHLLVWDYIKKTYDTITIKFLKTS